MTRKLCWLVLVTTLAACANKADDATPWRKPGDKIDSILPMPELLRRFRVGLQEPTVLSNGASSPEALARQYLQAVAISDTAPINALLLSRAEFAWLLFPDHLYYDEPYALDPDIMWLQLSQETQKGRSRVLQRYGNQRLTFRGLSGCQRDTLQITRGIDTLWTGCSIRYQAGDSTLTRALFGTIVQRAGVYKFLSYHTEF